MCYPYHQRTLEEPHAAYEDWPLGRQLVHSYFMPERLDPFACVGDRADSWFVAHSGPRDILGPSLPSAPLSSQVSWAIQHGWTDGLMSDLEVGPWFEEVLRAIGSDFEDMDSIHSYGTMVLGLRWSRTQVRRWYDDHTDEYGWWTEAELNESLWAQYARVDGFEEVTP